MRERKSADIQKAVCPQKYSGVQTEKNGQSFCTAVGWNIWKRVSDGIFSLSGTGGKSRIKRITEWENIRREAIKKLLFFDR